MDLADKLFPYFSGTKICIFSCPPLSGLRVVKNRHLNLYLELYYQGQKTCMCMEGETNSFDQKTLHKSLRVLVRY